MKILSNNLILLAMILVALAGCNKDKSYLSSLEAEKDIDRDRNLLVAMQRTAKSYDNRNVIAQKTADKESVEPISFRELLEYLPQSPRGWTAAKPKGETNSLGDYSISQIEQTYTNGDKQVTISIFDWAFNSALYVPFLLTTEFSRESTAGYNKGIKIGDIPGREEYSYINKQGSLNLLVDSRFLIRIDGRNIEDDELRQWWQLIDRQSLRKIAET